MFWIRSIWQRTQINVWLFQTLFALKKDVLHVVKQYRHMTHETELQLQRSHIFSDSTMGTGSFLGVK